MAERIKIRWKRASGTRTDLGGFDDGRFAESQETWSSQPPPPLGPFDDKCFIRGEVAQV